jgi:homocitrate synthase NifV
VESGIHVDGILKQPECYEPFPPEMVGRKRKIVLGKQSGTASIRAKLAELNIPCAEDRIPIILEQVKKKAVTKNRAITKREFAKIVKGCPA